MGKKEIYESVANSGISWVDWIFDNTVDLLIFFSNKTGLGYTGINVLILIIVLLIIFISVGLNIYLLKKNGLPGNRTPSHNTICFKTYNDLLVLNSQSNFFSWGFND